MRIGAISDLHLDENDLLPILAALKRRCEDQKVQALIVPGDISSSWRFSLEALDALESGLGLPVYFVPGNHDHWNRDHPEEDAATAAAAFASREGCLSGRVLDLGGWQLVGETGWYDESLAEGRFAFREIEAMEYGGRTWQDKLYTRWPRPMDGQRDFFLDRLRASLEGLDPQRTIVVTHVVPRLEFTVQPPEGIWTYFNALLGSARYGELLAEKGVRAAIFGHVHYRKRALLDGVEWICPCLGTEREWRLGSLEAEVAEALAVLDLEEGPR